MRTLAPSAAPVSDTLIDSIGALWRSLCWALAVHRRIKAAHAGFGATDADAIRRIVAEADRRFAPR